MLELQDLQKKTRTLEQDYIIHLTNENKALLHIKNKLYSKLEKQYNILSEQKALQDVKFENLEILHEDLLSKYKKLEVNIESEKLANSQQISIKELENKRIIKENNELQTKIDNLKSEIERLKNKNIEISKDNKKGGKEILKESKLKDKQIKSLESENNKIKKELAKVLLESKNTLDEHKYLEEKSKKYEEATKDSETKLSDYQKSLAKTIKEFEEANKKREKEFADEKRKLVAKYEKAIEKNNELKNAIKNFEDLPEKMKNVDLERKKIRREYEDKILKNEKEYKNQLKEKINKIDELEYELYTKKDVLTINEEKENEIADLRKEIMDLKKTNFDNLQLSEKLKNENANYRKKILQKSPNVKSENQKNAEIIKLNSENDELKEKQRLTANKLEKLQLKYKTLQDDIKNIEESNKINGKIKTDKKYEIEMKKHKKAVENIQSKLKKREKQIKDLEDDNKKITEKNNALENKFSQVDFQKIVDLQDQVFKLNEKIALLEKSEFDQNESTYSMQNKDQEIKHRTKIPNLINETISSQKQDDDETFSDLSKIVENSRHVISPNLDKSEFKVANDKTLNSSQISVRSKRKTRTRLNLPKNNAKKTKKNVKAAKTQNNAQLEKSKSIINKKEPIELLLSDNKFTKFPAKIPELFDDLTFTEDFNFFGKKQK